MQGCGCWCSVTATNDRLRTIYVKCTRFPTSSITRLFCQNGLQARSWFEMCFYVLIPATLGVGAKTRPHTPTGVAYHEQSQYCRFMIGHSRGHVESRMLKFTPHCVYRPTWVAGKSVSCFGAYKKYGMAIKLIAMCAWLRLAKIHSESDLLKATPHIKFHFQFSSVQCAWLVFKCFRSTHCN